MKKMLILLLVLLFVLTQAGCGVKEKIENKVGEKIAEKMIEGATGSKVDISGDKVTIKDKESGVQATFGGTEWPKNVKILEFKKGKIASVIDDGDGSGMIVVEEVDKKDFEIYCDEIKKDFTENVFEMKSGEALSFAGENGKDLGVQLTYESQSKTLTIVTGKIN